jgi:hypothetical protein
MATFARRHEFGVRKGRHTFARDPGPASQAELLYIENMRATICVDEQIKWLKANTSWLKSSTLIPMPVMLTRTSRALACGHAFMCRAV